MSFRTIQPNFVDPNKIILGVFEEKLIPSESSLSTRIQRYVAEIFTKIVLSWREYFSSTDKDKKLISVLKDIMNDCADLEQEKNDVISQSNEIGTSPRKAFLFGSDAIKLIRQNLLEFSARAMYVNKYIVDEPLTSTQISNRFSILAKINILASLEYFEKQSQAIDYLAQDFHNSSLKLHSSVTEETVYQRYAELHTKIYALQKALDSHLHSIRKVWKGAENDATLLAAVTSVEKAFKDIYDSELITNEV